MAAASLIVALPGCDSRPDGGAPSTPPRIVSLMPATTAIVTALGAEASIVARTSADPSSTVLDPLPLVGDPLSPSLETLASVRPDLLLAWRGSAEAPLERTLNEGGRIVSFDIQSVADLRAAIATLGALLARQERADSLVRALDTDLARARNRAPDAPSPPRVAWVVWPHPPTLAGRGSFVDEILAIAGGRNVVREGEGAWPRLSWEELVARRPDVVVWPEGGGVPPPSAAPAAWEAVAAFREGRVIRVPADSVHVPGPWIGRWAERLARELESVR